MSNSIQRAMVNLTQLIRLHDYYEGAVELDKLGAIDMYYLEAINQLDNPTIGTISKLLGQSTPNTNYHIKKLKDLKGKAPWEKLMIARKRKTMVLCIGCHHKLHAGKL